MHFYRYYLAAATACLGALLFASTAIAQAPGATIIFDSYTPPNQAGFSSAGGIATRIAVSKTTTITNIGILNSMITSGDIKFVVFAYPSEQLLLATPSESLPPDSSGNYTWKISPNINLTLTARDTYDIGYISDVARDDATDYVSASQNGFTTDMDASIITDFASPQFQRVYDNGATSGVELYTVVPEPSAFALLGVGAIGLTALARRRRLGFPQQAAATGDDVA